jgi:hypothetical protein
MKKSIFMLGLLAITLTGCGEKQQPVGKLIFMNGDVTINKASAKAGLDVMKTSIITTGEKSYAHIKFNDNSFIAVTPNTTISLLKYNDSKESPVFEMSLKQGIIGFVSGSIAKLDPTKVHYRTQSATIGVRGSSGFIEVDKEGTTGLMVKDCCLTIYDNDSPEKIVELNKTGHSSFTTVKGKEAGESKIRESAIEHFHKLDQKTLDSMNELSNNEETKMINPTTDTRIIKTVKTFGGREPLLYNDVFGEKKKQQMREWEAERKAKGRGLK